MGLVALETILAELEQLHERCMQELLKPPEIKSILSDLDNRTRGIIPGDSELYRLYDRGMKEGTDWWRVTFTGYVDKANCKNIGRRINLIRQMLSILEPEFLRTQKVERTQIYFQAGEKYRANQELYRLLKRASQVIDIMDPYLDTDVFDFIDAIDTTINVRLITGNPKPLFVRQLHALQTTRSNIEASSNSLSHDRFVILDRQEAWHLGASINGLGKKACMISKVGETTQLTKIISDFQSWWSSGEKI